MELVVLMLFCIILVLVILVIFKNRKIQRLENDIIHIQKDLVEIRGVIYK
ncbi:MAG: hypothetical protein PUF50_02855 [Erysipelotrichaceae bacterium]|nr:hypothetical protein [Erysipelotrichaceae bacterium]